MEALICIILSGIAVGTAAVGLAEASGKYELLRRLRSENGGTDGGEIGSRFEWMVCGVEAFMSRIPLGGLRDFLRGYLAAAGSGSARSPERFIARLVLISLACAAASLSICPEKSSLVPFVGAVIGSLAFVAAVEIRRRARLEEILRELPTTLDMITLSVEAGLDFGLAVARIAEKSKRSPLRDELRSVTAEIKMGVPKAGALKNLGARVPLAEVRSLVSTIVQADRLGSPIGRILRAHAEQARHDRLMRAERAGVAAANKILFPLVLCIMPVTFIVVFGPLAAKLMTGGIEAMFK